MIVTIDHPNWLQDDLIEGEKHEVTFQLEREFCDPTISDFLANAEVEDSMSMGNYTIEVFEL